MNIDPRVSDEPCPVCGKPLRQPVPDDGWFEWDCYPCGFEIPRRVCVDGLALIRWARTQTDPKAALDALLNTLTEAE